MRRRAGELDAVDEPEGGLQLDGEGGLLARTNRFDTEIRKIACTTNAIESMNARIRRVVKARRHFPNEAAAFKCVHMAIMSLDPTGTGRRRWAIRCKAALNAFDTASDGRPSAGRS